MASSASEMKAAIDHASTTYSRRARYHSSDNNFDFSWPAVPAHQFVIERDRALDPTMPTGLIALDLGRELGVDYPATTPTLLTRYAKIKSGETLSTRFQASGTVYYVIRGRGESATDSDRIEWSTGDLFCFPGGQDTRHQAKDHDCLLFLATNEPLLSIDRLDPPAPERAVVAPVHWPAAEIERQFEAVLKRPITPNTSGHAVLFSSEALSDSTNVLPTVNCAINTLESGKDQRPHRHNGVAVTLCIQGQGVYSMIGDQRVDWTDYAVQITPPAELHSHHNRGLQRMECLIFQDEALHYYTRTPGFSWN
ncbi:MAG: hypothetical protein VX249_08530 [Pseudomonadota bacterium]|nr:hypothetical protein [Pseudomonadota bacterium]